MVAHNGKTILRGTGALAALVAAAPTSAEISFEPETVIATTAGVGGIVLADFNGDRHLDIALLEGRFGFPATGFVQVLLNEGDGKFGTPQTINLGTFGSLELFVDEMVSGDFDGDQDLDLAFVGTTAPLTLLVNNGRGSFSGPQPTSLTVDSSQLNALLGAGDLDGDGDDDIVLGKPVRIAYSGGFGQFTVADFPFISSDEQLAVVDLNGDQMMDVAVGNRAFVNAGSGNFAHTGTFLAAGAFECAYRNLAGSPVADVACARLFSSEIRVTLNNGDATFGAGKGLPVEFPFGIASGDLNADGRADLAVRSGESVAFFAGLGDGNFDNPRLLPTPAGREIGVGDLSGDGVDDVVIGVGNSLFGGQAAIIILIARPGAPQPGDVNADGVVNIADVLAVIASWGPCVPLCSADVYPHPGGNGVVNLQDLLFVIANWG